MKRHEFAAALAASATTVSPSTVAASTNREYFPVANFPLGRAPFSEAVRAGNTYYIAGRIGLDPATNKPPHDVRDEVRLLMDGLRGLLTRLGLSMSDLVQVTVHTPDVSMFAQFNEIYVRYFDAQFPARAFLGSGPLLFGARFELAAIAVKD